MSVDRKYENNFPVSRQEAMDMIRQMTKRQTRVKARILMIAAVSFASMLIVALVMLTNSLIHYRRDDKLYVEARALAVQAAEPMQAFVLTTPLPGATATREPKETPPIKVDFVVLREEGRNVLGWLYSADTLINYPVVYYSNNSYYLTHNYTGTRSKGGALFFDTRLTKQLAEQNIILYGHHMKDRSMFGSLLQYQKQSYYDEHSIMYLLTPEKNYRIDLFAAQFTGSEEERFPVWFASEQERQVFVKAAVTNSTFTPADTSYHTGGQIISLVTCAYSDYIKDAKFQVHGWLTQIG
jgi:sortase B